MSPRLKIFIFNQSVLAFLIISYACFSFILSKIIIKNETKNNLLRPSINIKEL